MNTHLTHFKFEVVATMLSSYCFDLLDDSSQKDSDSSFPSSVKNLYSERENLPTDSELEQ